MLLQVHHRSTLIPCVHVHVVSQLLFNLFLLLFNSPFYSLCLKSLFQSSFFHFAVPFLVRFCFSFCLFSFNMFSLIRFVSSVVLLLLLFPFAFSFAFECNSIFIYFILCSKCITFSFVSEVIQYLIYSFALGFSFHYYKFMFRLLLA